MTDAPVPESIGRRLPVYASYFVVLGMVICFAITAIQFVQWVFPIWDSSGMLIICILAALEAVASSWLIKRLPTAQRQLIYFRFTEWVIIVVILKLFAELVIGPANFWANLSLWLNNFPINIFNGHFFLTLVPFFVVWLISNLFAADLSELEIVESGLLDERANSTPIRELILRRFLNLGMFVVLLAGIPPQVVIPGTRPLPPNYALPAVLIYFVLGIILLSLTRYTNLVSNWRLAKVNIPVQIPRRWFAYSAVILVFLVLLIAWLPTNYGMGLFTTIDALYNLIIRGVITVYAFIFLLINAIFRLFFHQAGPLPTMPAEQFSQPPAQLIPTNQPADLTLLKSILFWVGLVVLVVVALRQYILFNKDLSEELKRFRPLRWLVLFLKRVTASVKKANKSVSIFVQSSLKRLRNIGRSPAKSDEWGFINPRRLNPRQKIIFYYLTLVRRADEAGLPRKDEQTPYEYAQSLTSSLEEGKDSVDALTMSFVEARYSRHDIPAKEARRVESLWETIRRVLRIVRKSRREEKRSGKD